jgi:putative flippase GtrA
MPYALATVAAGEVSTLLRFLVVDRWVFEHRRPTWKRLIQYHVANAASFGIWWTAANGMKMAGVPGLWAAGLAMGCSVGLSVLSNFFWIWRRPAVAASPTV